ncbi:probable glycosyltransferase At5g03795 isoform X1 [Dendrobium catenatum]|uniref:probable glycosyltransferase At5g03795 isoform X1 n=1 Tax=Dendrobium catenatum TaxID=906689 RepID=UPI0009F35AC2|nr:probable glycosyltransferase At5g03795 isoform X1 [Dendrobium catenatum]
MPVPHRPVGAAPCASLMHRGRCPARNSCRLILIVALIATALIGFLNNTLPPLPKSFVSVITPSSTFAVTNSSHGDSIVFSLDSRNSALIVNSKVDENYEVKAIHTGNKKPDSCRTETHLKEGISGDGGLPAFTGREVPFWALPPDEALLYAKREIEHAPLLVDDPDLYAPVFWNLSVFKRSYELMEKILKVYIYPDGSRPIFHTPELQGIYASEGWFMKLMEESRQFAVKDPKKAHLFYLPYSSRRLRDAVYTPGSHNIKPLAIFLRDYVNNISSKYPFWNRTRGSDHFLVACHDWGPYSTTSHTELRKNTIKALCNADTSEGIFIRGKDVSLPETTIKEPKRPLKYIGGKRLSQRPILAFYAGLMHGRVRPTLEKLWGNDTEGDIRIFRRLPRRVSRNMSYVEHMKSSRFCICPMGYEVNSPRIVEAIYYECVPVIIADNFVLPFEEVLNWSTFSVVIAEKDIADLKKILLEIPLKRYLKMQECVKRVQKHFLWHAKPEKYDLFHVILHSIWFSRLKQIQMPL